MNLIEKISTWLKGKGDAAGAQGAVFGISGGIDSAVVAGLAKHAWGDNVLGLMMPCHSMPYDAEHALLVVNKFDIPYSLIDLTPIFDEFKAVLPEGNRLADSNLKARMRMATLYHHANTRNYVVIGTGNKAELMVGYFTKYGDSGVDLLPLGDLLKREVRAVARELGVPQVIIDKPPSAGLWPGQTDEAEMGITYDELDDALAALESGDTAPIAPEVLAKVRQMVETSAHKRSLAPICKIR